MGWLGFLGGAGWGFLGVGLLRASALGVSLFFFFNLFFLPVGLTLPRFDGDFFCCDVLQRGGRRLLL